MRNGFIISILVSTICLSNALAQSKLPTWKAYYNSSLKKIEESSGSSESVTAYLNALTAMKTKFQTAGDLDSLIIVNKEITRFRTSKTVASGNIVSEPAELKDLQTKQVKSASGSSLEKSKSVLSLTAKYVAKLEGLQKSLTKSGNIDAALKVNAEIKRVKSSPTVTAAEFEIASSDSAKPIDDTTTTSADTNKPRTKRINIPGEPMIFSGKNRPPTRKGQRFAKHSLKTTSLVPMSRQQLSISGLMAKEKNTDRSSTYYSKSKQSTVSTTFRTEIKTTKSSVVLDDITIVLQIYGKATGSSKGIQPILIATESVEISKVDKNKITIEWPAVINSNSKVTTSYYGLSGSKDGVIFYGIIVSAFSKNDDLIFQSVSSSANTLNEVTSPEKPQLPKGQKAVEFNGHWYKFFPQRTRWHDAKTRCESMKGNLISIQTKAENDFARTLCRMSESSYVIIGLSDEEAEGSWVWASGKPLTYKNWAPSEPDNGDDDFDEHYGVIFHQSGRWRDYNRHISAPYICEWDELE